MATIDIVIAAIMGISFLVGVLRGLVKEALSLFFWIAAVVAAGMFNAEAGQLLSGMISSPLLQRVVGFVLLFVAVVFVGGLLGNLLSTLFSQAGLAAADRALGGLFGIVRGLVIVTLLVWLTSRFAFLQTSFSESIALPYFAVLADLLQGWFETLPPLEAPVATPA